MRIRMLLSTVLIATAVACTPSPSTDNGAIAAGPCSAGPVIDVTNVDEARTVTDLVFLQVDARGTWNERRASDYPRSIAPSATSGSQIPIDLLVDAVAATAGDARAEPGPPSVESAELREELSPGAYLMYAGATQLDATFHASCVGTDRSTLDGRFLSWGGPIAGILACDGEAPPEGSFGALVADACRS